MSLINCLAFKMNEVDSSIFKGNLLITREFTFNEMENKVREMSIGLDLKVIGKNIIKEDHEISSVLSKV